MDHNSHTRLILLTNALPRLAGATAIAVGSSVIVGWILDVPLLKSLSPDMLSMKANAASNFVLAGIALLLHSVPGAGNWRRTARFLASLVFLVGLLTVAEYAFAWDAGIDQLLFNEPHRAIGTYSPGRMALNTAISFCLVGLALVTIKGRNRWGEALAQIAALVVGLLGLLGLLAYVYGLSEFSGYAIYTRMALHTAGTCLFLSVGVLCLEPDVGIMIVVTSQSSGGFMARRLMLAAVVVPLALGWLIVGGETWGWYGGQFSDVIFATAYIAIAVALVWRIARSLNQMDAERKSAAEALRQTEAHYRLMVEHASDLIYNIDAQGYVTSINPAASCMLGYLPNEVVGRRYLEFVRPDFRRRAERIFIVQLLKKTPSVYNEAPILTKDGRELWIGQHVGLIFKNDEVVGFLAVSRDITERKRMEEELKKSEEKYRSIFENVQDVYFETLFNGTILEISPSIQFVSKGQYHRADLIGRSMYDFYNNPDDRLTMLVEMQKAGCITDFEVQFKNRDGSILICSLLLKVKLDAEGRPEKIIGSMRDITERKRAEEALRESEEWFRTLADTTSTGIFIYRDVRIVYVNRAAGMLSGYTAEEFLALRFWDLIHPDYRELVRERGLARQRDEPKPARYEVKMMRKDGEVRWIDFTAGKISWQGRPAVLGTVFDITERKRAEEEREELVKELQTALEHVQTLGGLVPICASCKKIRDDKGYWTQLEKYLGDHTHAMLTHGLCPDCTKLYFPSDAAKTSPGEADEEGAAVRGTREGENG